MTTLIIKMICHYARWNYAVWNYAECHILFSIILSIIALSVIMLNVVMLSVMAPGTQCGCAGIFPRKEGGIRVLAGLAQSSQTVGSIMRKTLPNKTSQKYDILGKTLAY